MHRWYPSFFLKRDLRKMQETIKESWLASCIFYERPVTIAVKVPGFTSEKKAEAYTNASNRLHLRSTSAGASLVLSANGCEYVVPRGQVKIQIDPPNMPRPLDSRDPDDFKKIMDSIGDPTSPYHINEEDLAEVDWSYEKLAEVLGYISSFDYLACGAWEEEKCNF
jgi:hypothetical protein